MRGLIQFILTALVLVMSVKVVSAESWTLWAKIESFYLDTSGKKIQLESYWEPALYPKESITLPTEAECQAVRLGVIQDFRRAQGETTNGNKTETRKVEGETITITMVRDDGKGVAQTFELVCRTDEPSNNLPPF